MNGLIEQVDILDRLRSGEPIRLDDPEYYKISEVVDRTIKLSQQLNNATDISSIRNQLSELICS